MPAKTPESGKSDHSQCQGQQSEGGWFRGGGGRHGDVVHCKIEGGGRESEAVESGGLKRDLAFREGEAGKELSGLRSSSNQSSVLIRVEGKRRGGRKSLVAKSKVTALRGWLKLTDRVSPSCPAGPGSPRTLPVKVSKLL